MIKFHNLRAMTRYLNRIITLSLGIILLIIFIIWMMTLTDLARQNHRLIYQEIRSTTQLFESILSQQLVQMANSPSFIRFLKSGEITRHSTRIDFLSKISILYSLMLVGMQIQANDNTTIFADGRISDTFVNFKLCYLSKRIHAAYGNCYYHWTLYFDKTELMNEIHHINKHLKPCTTERCHLLSIFNKRRFGDFPIEQATPFFLTVELPNSTLKIDTIFIAFVLLIGLLGL